MTTPEQPQRVSRDSRLNIRTTTRQDTLLRQAAAATDRTVSDFVLESAVTRAERVLADRRWFVLDEAKWLEFQRLLEQPIPEIPKLTKLFERPDPFTDAK
jgi:uncharacterized protein (DUF1778 family)